MLHVRFTFENQDIIRKKEKGVRKPVFLQNLSNEKGKYTSKISICLLNLIARKGGVN